MAQFPGQAPQDPIEELLPAYALNALDPQEQERVERALEQDERYRDLLAQYLEASVALSESHLPETPSPMLRKRVMAAARAAAAPETMARPPARLRASGAAPWLRGVPVRVWSAAAVFLVLLSSFGAFMAYQQGRIQRLETDVVANQQQILEQQGTQEGLAVRISDEMERTKGQLQQQRAAMYWAALPGVDTVLLESAVRSGPRAMLMMNPDHTAGLLVVLELEPLAEGVSYQAWFWRRRGLPTRAAEFTADVTGYAQVWVRMEEGMSEYHTVSISMEPDGDDSLPQGTKLLQGALQ